MGARTQSRIGTMEGVKTVRVFSANPKTRDGYNTFIFRRELARSLQKLDWLPVIDGETDAEVRKLAVGGKEILYSAEFRKRVRKLVARMASGQKGLVDNADFGRITIGRDYVKETQIHSIRSRAEIESVASARKMAATMVHLVASPNDELQVTNGILYFEYGLAKIRLSDGLYLVMGEVGVRLNSRPYYDQRVVAKFKADSEAPPLHGHLRIGESALDGENDNKSFVELQGGLVTSKEDSEASSIQGHMQYGESTFDAVYDNRFRLILQAVAAYNKV